MSTADILINGKKYAVACTPGEENKIRSLAQLVDQKVKQLSANVAVASDAHLLALASLMLAAEITDLKAKDEAAKSAPKIPAEEEKTLVAAVDYLSDRIQSIADQLKAA